MHPKLPLVLEWAMPFITDSDTLKSLSTTSVPLSNIAQSELLRNLRKIDPYISPDIDLLLQHLVPESNATQSVHAVLFEMDGSEYSVSDTEEQEKELDEARIRDAIARVASVIKRFPNLQTVHFAVYGTEFASVDLTPIFEAISHASRRNAVTLDFDVPWHFEEISRAALELASQGLRSLDVKFAEELGFTQIETLINGASSTLTDLSIPSIMCAPGHETAILMPRLKSFTLIELGEVNIVPLLTQHPHISELVIAGGDPQALSAALSVTRLTLELELTPTDIAANLAALPSPRCLRELHISLIEPTSELLLREAFLGLPSLEELSISGWFVDDDAGPCVLQFTEDHNHWETIYDTAISSHSQVEQVFPSLQRLEVYYTSMRLFPLPRFPSIVYFAPGSDGRDERVQLQQDHARFWARACRPLLVKQMEELATKMPLKRVRWVPCHYVDHSDDFDLIIRRDEGTISVDGGFARVIPPDEPKWKGEKIASEVQYDGPWEVSWNKDD